MADINKEDQKKIKILVLGDHPLHPSGVGIQTRYMIESMLGTGKFTFVCLGGAIKHQDYSPVKTEEWGDDWRIFPVDGYGTPDVIRSILRTERPDILWFMTDPRFWTWLWQMEDEIRPLVPMIYYHVWDNKPYPIFNKPFYESNDHVVSISKVTQEILENVAPDVNSTYLPHAVDTGLFRSLPEEDVWNFRKEHFSDEDDDKILFFWNNRNARRKQSGTLLFWFKEYLDKVGHNKAKLIMHTDTRDPNGQNLDVIVQHLGLLEGQVLFSRNRLPPEGMSLMYNMVDCTINIADAEGFGLSTFESLACETPIIVTMTGGLQEQVTDGENWFGIGIKPSSQAIIGSQDIPFIYEDRINKEEFIDAMVKITEMTKEERRELGIMGRRHVLKNYNFENFVKSWEKILLDVHERCGSWQNRKDYKAWELLET